MGGHLTEQELVKYARISEMTPENIAFVAEINLHAFDCDRCRDLLDIYCEREERQRCKQDEPRLLQYEERLR